jgi:acyl-CoA thioester hydrolase
MPVRVRYPEVDPMGRLHHGVYLVYFEMGRTELMRQRGVTYRDMEARGRFVTIIDIHVRYRAAARYDDELVVETWIEAVRGARVIFGNRVVRADPTGPTVLAEATVTGALLGADGHPMRFTEEDEKIMLGELHEPLKDPP